MKGKQKAKITRIWQIMIDSRLQDVKVIVFGESSTQESVLQSSSFGDGAFKVEHLSYRRDM